ncbi:MAG: hypothetical protein B6U89_07730 [Desulfurococcales archaeon ex4484_58]|nr:MAG: hypothetical protein B6U89_07730 [Desulfurococcales archaeon ex4484_58]
MFKENTGEKKESRNEVKEAKKVDVSKLVSIIPPPSELRRKETRITEKRIRIRYDESLAENTAKISKKLAETIGVKEDDQIEIVVAGKKKFIFKATISGDVEENQVYCYPEELREKGVADNSIATIRKHRG